MMSENQFNNVCDEELSNKIFSLVNNYVNKKYKGYDKKFIDKMLRYKINKLLSLLDKESPNYDKDFFKNGDLIESIGNDFSDSSWNKHKEMEIKRIKAAKESKLEPNTDELCYKCKKSEIYVYELQTRAADESTTLFYKCLNCGNNWKF